MKRTLTLLLSLALVLGLASSALAVTCTIDQAGIYNGKYYIVASATDGSWSSAWLELDSASNPNALLATALTATSAGKTVLLDLTSAMKVTTLMMQK